MEIDKRMGGLDYSTVNRERKRLREKMAVDRELKKLADKTERLLKSKIQTWWIFNTEDIVPTVPPAAVQIATPNMGMHGMTVMTQSLIKFVQLSPLGYQHIGYPIAAIFHRDTVADNHSLDELCIEIAKP